AAIKLDVSVVTACRSSKDRGRHQARRLAARRSSTDRTPATSAYPYSRVAGRQGPTTQPVGLECDGLKLKSGKQFQPMT
ncbi:hypothetical protein Drorol1_Dr00028330, partial [Drosera rotundifolia]